MRGGEIGIGPGDILIARPEGRKSSVGDVAIAAGYLVAKKLEAALIFGLCKYDRVFSDELERLEF